MPNGHTGGFLISKSELTHVLSSLPNTSIVAESLGAMGRTRREGAPTEPTTVADLVRLVEQFEGENLYVEEHDFAFYQIYLDHTLQQFVLGRAAPGEAPQPTWEKLMVVHSDSPLFDALRERHTARRNR